MQNHVAAWPNNGLILLRRKRLAAEAVVDQRFVASLVASQFPREVG